MKTTYFVINTLLAATVGLMCYGCKPPTIDVPCPKIKSFAPKGGAFGEVITTTGEGFCAGRSDLHIVKIGNTIVPEASVTVVDDQTITFPVPKGAENGNISVTLKRVPDCPGVSGQVFTYYYTATVSTFAGQTPGALSGPVGLDIDQKGIIWVADQAANVIRKIGPDGNVIGTIGGASIACSDLPVTKGNPVSFNKPTDVVTDPAGNVFVADKNNNVIKKINVAEGIDPYAGRCGDSDEVVPGTCGTARFLGPFGLCHDNGRLYVLDGGQIKKIDENCNVSRLVNSGGMITFANTIAFSRARPGAGPLIVAENVGAKGLFSVNDNTGEVSAIPLSEPPTMMTQPAALQLDAKGNIFIADKAGNQIFVAYTDGHLAVLAGTGNPLDATGNGKVASFKAPSGLLLVAENGSPLMLYVSDFGNSKIKRIILE